MPVGTQGTVKGLTVDMLASTGAQMILGNTYHLALRPGEATVAALGGLHQFMGWSGPILTDSGGFQLLSLADRTKVTDDGAVFHSHIDGRLLSLSPERSIAIQESLGSDIAMVLDHVVPLPATSTEVHSACERTIRWAERCRAAATRGDQLLFAIVQGGLDIDLRCTCAGRLKALDFPGYAIGGLSVGEDATQRDRVLAAVCPALPRDRPRYLMGVGTPDDVLSAIGSGVDMFDCVLPTRNGRNALAYTDRGPIRLRNRIHATDDRPLDENCPCPACRHSRAYLRHLFQAKEMLGPILVSAHNLTYYQQLLAGARQAIERNEFGDYLAAKRCGWADQKAAGGID
jgi:queuine tRNA-ribosyltransferase